MKKVILLVSFLIVGFLAAVDFKNIEGDIAWAKALISTTPIGSALTEFKRAFFGKNPDFEEIPLIDEPFHEKDSPLAPQNYGEGKIENLAVLVPSCDKYHSVWGTFFSRLFKYWPHYQQQTYLIANTKTYDDSRVKTILFPQEISWSDNLLKALDQIEEDYVLLILEDFMIYKPININKIKEYLEIMQEKNIVFLQLIKAPFYPTHLATKDLRIKGSNENFSINCQAGIWKKDALKRLLVQYENPWQFEIYGTWRSKKTYCPIFSIATLDAQPIFYHHAIVGGHWIPSIVETLKKEGIFMPTDLPIKEFSYADPSHSCNLSRPRRESFRTTPLYPTESHAKAF